VMRGLSDSRASAAVLQPPLQPPNRLTSAAPAAAILATEVFATAEGQKTRRRQRSRPIQVAREPPWTTPPHCLLPCFAGHRLRRCRQSPRLPRRFRANAQKAGQSHLELQASRLQADCPRSQSSCGPDFASVAVESPRRHQRRLQGCLRCQP
jgi:hypothetical protein